MFASVARIVLCDETITVAFPISSRFVVALAMTVSRRFRTKTCFPQHVDSAAGLPPQLDSEQEFPPLASPSAKKRGNVASSAKAEMGSHQLKQGGMPRGAADGPRFQRILNQYGEVSPGIRAPFANEGNTCWLGALMQSLFHTHHFADWVKSRQCTCKKTTCHSCLFDSTFEDSNQPGGAVRLWRWKDLLHKMNMGAGVMQDPGEMLKMIINDWSLVQGPHQRVDYLSFTTPCSMHWRLKQDVTPQCGCVTAPFRTSYVAVTEGFLDLHVAGSEEATTIQKLLADFRCGGGYFRQRR